MRTIAILAAVVIGWFIAILAISVVEVAYEVDSGPIGAVGAVVMAIALGILVARLVPRSPRAQARQDRAAERIATIYRRG
jgi:hypothetical protein